MRQDLSDLELTIIATEEQLRNQTNKASFRTPYFTEGDVVSEKKNHNIILPNGYEKTIEGYELPAELLNQWSQEMLALHLLDHCNFSCFRCGAYATPIVPSKPVNDNQYLQPAVLEKIAEVVAENPNRGRERVVFVTGGEPTLNLDLLVQNLNILSETLQGKRIRLATNAFLLPPDLSPIPPEIEVQLTYSPSHEFWYSVADNSGGEVYFDPNVHPLERYRKKIKDILEANRGNSRKVSVVASASLDELKRYAKRLGISIANTKQEYNGLVALHGPANVYYHGNCSPALFFRKRLEGYLGSNKSLWTTDTWKLGRAANGSLELEPPSATCSDSEELYLHLNGGCWPHCQHYFRSTNLQRLNQPDPHRIATVGFKKE